MAVRDSISEIWQEVYYGLLKNKPTIDFSQIPTNLRFSSHYDRISKVHWIDSPDLPGLIVSAKDTKDLPAHIHDTLMVYFDVPTYFAKKMKPTIKLTNFHNKKTNKMETLELEFKKELSEVLA